MPALEDILLSDGKKVYAGFLETIQPEEDLVFYDCLSRGFLEDITHWMPLPKPPLSEGSQVASSKQDDNPLNRFA